MTWKSYAVVSGATVLAGWLASPSSAPPNAQSPQARTPPPSSRAIAAASTDIELQAMRLQARLRPEGAYAEPSRDPFRFAPRRAGNAVVDRELPAAAAPPPDAVETPLPPAPMVSLSGIAEDEAEGRTVRTAVLSSPGGVLLVREGEEVLGFYRVGRIESEAVELVRLADGSTTRLSLK